MALTLAEAAKLSNDILLQGVIGTIIKDSPILQRMPFIEIAGNGLTYNREATAPSAAFFDVAAACPASQAANPKTNQFPDKPISPLPRLSTEANGGSLTLDKLDEVIDKVLGGK